MHLADITTTVSRSTPATYFLSINGIRLLRQFGYPEAELRKRYKDGGRQPDFVRACKLVADCALHLETRNATGGGTLHYDYAVEANYVDPTNNYSFFAESEHIHPKLAFTKTQTVDGKATSQTYLLELFDVATPRYMIRRAIRNHIAYLESDEWAVTSRDEPLPICLFACPDLRELISAKHYANRQLYDMWDDTVPDYIHIRFSTIEKMKTKGMTAVIWEDA